MRMKTFNVKKCIVVLSFAAILLLGIPLHAQSGLSFVNSVDYASAGYTPLSVAVADVNGDGKPDLLVTNICVSSSSCGHGTVSVLLGL